MKKSSKEHTQLIGKATYDMGPNTLGETKRTVLFQPDESIIHTMESWTARGKMQVHSDGTSEFISMERRRAKTRLIKKIPHGRLSETQDGAYLLTIKIYRDEPGNIAHQMLCEATEATTQLVNENT